MSTKLSSGLLAFTALFALSACDSPEGTRAEQRPGANMVAALPAEVNAQRERPLWEVHEGSNAFEDWAARGDASVLDAIERAPDETITSDLIQLGSRGVIGIYNPEVRVEAGDRFVGRVWLRGHEGGRVNLQLLSWCSLENPEIGSNVVTPSTSWELYEVEYTFAHAHDCVRFQLAGLSEHSAFYGWNASLRRE